MRKHTVFVYGTLRKHEKNHGFLVNAKCLAQQCWTHGFLYDTNLGYPGMVAGQGRVYGELYQVTEEELKAIDRLEGYEEGRGGNQFERVRRPIYTDWGMKEAFVYFLVDVNQSNQTPVIYGNWRCRSLLDKEYILYFAYGSCMDHERFRLHGVDSLFQDILGKGTLKGYSLRYTHHSSVDGMGRADLVEGDGYVEGKVYQIQQEALQYLFHREGVHNHTYRPAVIDLEIDGKQIKDVLTFFVVNKKEEVAPPNHYALEILRGGQGFLSERYLEEVRRDLKEKFNMVVDEGKSSADQV